MRYLTWLRLQKDRDDIVGDLARDLVLDEKLNNMKYKSYQEFKSRLSYTHRAIKDALKESHKEYKALV